MTNRETIIQLLSDKFTIGCYDKTMESISKKELSIVTKQMFEESTDITIMIKKQKFIVTVDTVDGEKDFSIRSEAEYIGTFGDPLDR